MTQDTRKDPRAKIVSLNVRYKSATVDEFIENHSHDVSKGGIFIKTSTPFPQGTLLKFEIRLAGDQAVIAGVGRVVWKREPSTAGAERPAGMGVKFIKIDENSRAVIDRLVNAKEDAGSAFTAELKDSIAPKGAPEKTTPGIGGGASVPPRPGKSTLLGVGMTGSVPPAGKGSPSGAPKPGVATLQGVPPAAAGGAGAMFPKTNSEAEMPAPAERTMMKQAAELLEEALKGAGGSMDEVGQNPLFTGDGEKAAASPSGAPAAAAVPSSPPKVTEGSVSTGLEPVIKSSADPLPVTVRDSPAAKEAEERGASDRPEPAAAAAARSERPAPAASERPAPASSRAPKPASAVAALSSTSVAPPPGKRPNIALWAALVLVAGVVVIGFTKPALFGLGGTPAPSVTASAPPPPPSSTDSAGTPPTAPTDTVANTSATTDAAVAAITDAAPADAALAATAKDAGRAAEATTSGIAATTPKPRPPTPKPTATATSTSTGSGETAPSSTGTSSEGSSDKAPSSDKPEKAPAPEKKPAKPTKPEDTDNPY
jgi:uncharacterized protein (TIGR02266 family)